ncbi:MAG: hypothetical protein ACXAD7_26040, partial [Candidatus Kariarchaeaceae archaeon]
GNVHFVYFDESPPDGRHVKHRIYYPDTDEFSTETSVTTEPSYHGYTRPGEYMSIRLDSNDIPHVVWSDTRNLELDIYYANANLETPPTTTSPTFTIATGTSTPSTSSKSTNDESPILTINLFMASLMTYVVFRKKHRRQ